MPSINISLLPNCHFSIPLQSDFHSAQSKISGTFSQHQYPSTVKTTPHFPEIPPLSLKTKPVSEVFNIHVDEQFHTRPTRYKDIRDARIQLITFVARICHDLEATSRAWMTNARQKRAADGRDISVGIDERARCVPARRARKRHDVAGRESSPAIVNHVGPFGRRV